MSLLLAMEATVTSRDDSVSVRAATVVSVAILRWVSELVRARPLLADALLAIALFFAELGLWGLDSGSAGYHPASFPAWWLAVGIATLTLRRRWPWLAVILLSTHTAVSQIVDLPNEGPAIVVLTYTLAAHRSARMAATAGVVLWAPGLVLAVALHRHLLVCLSIGVFLAFNGLIALAGFLTGRIVFHRRRHVAALVERALAAEQNQQTLAAQAVADERRRIARELHDMVAHHVSVMGVLATGSRRALRTDPAAADEALATIEETGRTALREMRRLLDVLRTDPEPAGELTPQPGLAGLAGLVEQVREAGLPVSMRTSGESGPIGPGIALAIYRIVQEALTNVLKHAGGDATAEVRLDLGPRWLSVEVFDTGRGPRPRTDSIGHGLLGMRERVALYGGTLRTGPRPGGGFRLLARIPTEEGVRESG